MYAVIGEGLSSEVEELVTYLVVTYDNEASVTASRYVTYGEGLNVDVTFF